jgi:hypothetical protein
VEERPAPTLAARQLADNPPVLPAEGNTASTWHAEAWVMMLCRDKCRNQPRIASIKSKTWQVFQIKHLESILYKFLIAGVGLVSGLL